MVAIMTKAACVGSCKGMKAMKSCLHILFHRGLTKYLCIFVHIIMDKCLRLSKRNLQALEKRGNFSINQNNLALDNGENSLITFDAVAHWLQK